MGMREFENERMKKFLFRHIDIAPLVTFRILFGALMAFGAIRFMFSGWIEKLYVEPQFFFKFYGFEWVQPLGGTGMYMLYGVIALSAIMIMLGLFYRLGAILFFLSFTYAELIDATNYLNHYYLVVLLGFLLMFLPANRALSLDVRRKPILRQETVPAWCIYILIAQLTLVYTFAGIAKLNYDWFFRAMPMAVWLPEHTNMPLFGPLFEISWMPFAFSWLGAIYDLTIAYFLMWRVTRPYAYIVVIVFHTMTYLLFNIGLFPLIMTLGTLVFFSGEWHRRVLKNINFPATKPNLRLKLKPKLKLFSLLLISAFLLIQLLLPLRYLLYPDNLFWTEEGYRFSWRVMLLEKAGQATFYIEDRESGRKSEVNNAAYLTSFQEKQMAMQPDFILQYAHFLAEAYAQKYDLNDPIVKADIFVALNGKASERFIDPKVDLTRVKDGFGHKEWIMKKSTQIYADFYD